MFKEMAKTVLIEGAKSLCISAAAFTTVSVISGITQKKAIDISLKAFTTFCKGA